MIWQHLHTSGGYPQTFQPLPEKGMLSPASEPSQGGPRIFRGTLGEETLERVAARDGGHGDDNFTGINRKWWVLLYKVVPPRYKLVYKPH